MSISTCQSIRLYAETSEDIKKVNLHVDKTDSTCDEVEYSTVLVAAGTTVVLGSATPARVFGRIATGLKTTVSTDQPVSIQVTFYDDSVATIPVTDILVLNSSIKYPISITAGVSLANVQVAIAGLV